MKSSFTIYQTCTSDEVRPPISRKVREYFEQFLTTELLEKMKILTNAKWHVCLSILFVEEGARYTSTTIHLAKCARTISAERVKLFEVLIPLKNIVESDDHFLKTVEMIYEAVSLFFTSTYRKVTPSFMRDLWEKVDLEYLRALPYPTPLAEQRYVGDKIGPDGRVEFLKFMD